MFFVRRNRPKSLKATQKAATPVKVQFAMLIAGPLLWSPPGGTGGGGGGPDMFQNLQKKQGTKQDV